MITNVNSKYFFDTLIQADSISIDKMNISLCTYRAISIMHFKVHKHFIVHMGQFLESIGDRIPSFVGIKFTSGNLEEGAQALRADNGKYVIFLGNDQVIRLAREV